MLRRIAVAAVLLVLAGCTGDADEADPTPRPEPTGPRATLVLRPTGTASGADLAAVQQVLQARVTAADLEGTAVAVQGSTVRLTVLKSDLDVARTLSGPGRLRVRPVQLGPVQKDIADVAGVTPAQKQALSRLDCAATPAPDRADVTLAACGEDSKYLLQPAIIDNEGIDGVAPLGPDGANSGWRLVLTWTGPARRTFSDYTRRHNVSATPNTPTNQLAFVLDGRVITAPEIQGPIEGPDTEISGNFDGPSTRQLAALLGSGALPVPMTVE